MCPPLCSAGLAAFANFCLLVYAFSLPDWGPTTALVFVAPFAAAVTLLFFYWNARIAWYAGWVLLVSSVFKLAACIVFVVGASQAAGEDNWLAGLAVIFFAIFAIGSGLSGAIDGWAGWNYACQGQRPYDSRPVPKPPNSV